MFTISKSKSQAGCVSKIKMIVVLYVSLFLLHVLISLPNKPTAQLQTHYSPYKPQSPTPFLILPIHNNGGKPRKNGVSSRRSTPQNL